MTSISKLTDEADKLLNDANLFKTIPTIILPCSMRFDLKRVDSMILKKAEFQAIFQYTIRIKLSIT